MVRIGCWMLLLLLTGCLDEERRGGLIRNEPFRSDNAPPIPKAPPASVAAASRVDALGRDILQANPDLPIQPQFLTYGSPDVSVFHRGTNELWVTEGMVNRCKDDGQLAAVLCMQLGKMVAEKDAFDQKRARNDRPLPPGTPYDITGASFNADQTDVAEMARFEKANPRRPRNEAPIDPRWLATQYLTRAKFVPEDLDAIQPLLAEAEKNYQLERQLTRGR